MTRPKIIHLPTSVGGNAWGLSQAERQIGLDSTVLVKQNDWFGYSSDINLNLQNKSKWKKLITLWTLANKIKNEYDIIHLNFGTSLLDFYHYGIYLMDLPLYKRSNKKIIVTYNGSDIRLERPIDKWDNIDKPSLSSYEIKLFVKRKKRVEKMVKYADKIIVLNPDLLKYIPSDNVYFVPYSISKWDTIKRKKQINKTKFTILHAPTNRDIKGSNHIISAVNSLKNQYNNIEFILIENMKHDDALELYQEADLIIDQVYIGWYGGFTVEAMKMGIPIAVYIEHDDLKYIDSTMAKELLDAIIEITPFNIEKVLKKYIENKELLKDKVESAFDYVNKWHDPIKIAKFMKENIYE